MILFYSDHCRYCRSLLEEINRRDGQGRIKLASVDSLVMKRQLPPQIHSVPALMLLPSKTLVFGRQVFDALFLPGRGALVTGTDSTGNAGVGAAGKAAGAVPSSDNPEPFSLNSAASMSDQFSFVGADEASDPLRAYGWSQVGAASGLEVDANLGQEVTKGKKGLPSLDEYKLNRDNDLKNYLSNEPVPIVR